VRARLLLPSVALAALAAPPATALAGQSGAAFTLSNRPAGNAVIAFARGEGGELSRVARFATGGRGTGQNLGSQGALALGPRARRLYAVNAASGSLTAFRVHGAHLRRLQVVGSGGSMPISVTARGARVYVLNAGGTPNVTGFRVTRRGLERIAGGRRTLAAGDAAPAQVELAPSGHVLVVTNKVSSTIDTIGVRSDGSLRRAVSHPSAGTTPFGFEFTRSGTLIVSDAGEAPTSAATSYAVGRWGALLHRFGPVQLHQLAACWVAITPDGRYAYTANAGSDSISGLRVGRRGQLTLLDGNGRTAFTGAGSHPLDEAITSDGRLFYVLADGKHRLVGFRIAADGSLHRAASAGRLPAGDVGLVVR
jgi:6-phosphogluconolactonase